MLNSIRARLTLSLVLASLVVGVIASGMAFYDTYRETHKLQDDLLKQISAYISPEYPLLSEQRSRNDAGISVYVVPRGMATPMVNFPLDISENFYTLKKEGDILTTITSKQQGNVFFDLQNAGNLYRAYVRVTPQGQIVVMQENEYRDGLARHAAWTSLLPMLVLLPLIALLTYFIVKQTVQPIERLSEKIAQRRQQDLTPLSIQYIPSEITGFVVAINQLLARTDQFIQKQKRFIADASHELRSPMTALSLQAERLSQHTLPHEIQPQVTQLNQGIRRSRELLEQLLSLARIQNAQSASPTQVAVHEVFSRVIEDVYPLAEQKEQDIGVVSQGNPQFYGNETDLYLLVKTLVDNAIRYTPQGSQIDLSAEEHDHALVIYVEDNGQGIAPEERERVLDPFYRILGSDQQGSGLGLAIADNIVQNYQGEIQLLASEHFRTGLLVKIIFKKRTF